jgi:hypothetical protein
MISDADVAVFRDRGLLRLPGAADPAGLAAARAAVFDILSRAGLWSEGEGWTLAGADRPRWPALGKAPAAFKDRRLAAALEALVPAGLIAGLEPARNPLAHRPELAPLQSRHLANWAS